MSQRATWWLAIVTAVLTSAGVVGLLTLRFEKAVSPIPVRSATEPASSKIGLSRLEQAATADLVVEEALFYDPTPMFLPTEWNSDQNSLPSNVLSDPGQMFQDFKARLVFQRDALSLNMPEYGESLRQPTDLVSGVEDMARLSGLGARDLKIGNLAPRGGYVEVVSMATGSVTYQAPLGMQGLGGDLWQPLELTGAVTAAGVVGQLSIVASTGGVELDQRIRDHLLKSKHLGEQLSPGFYRIFVGP